MSTVSWNGQPVLQAEDAPELQRRQDTHGSHPDASGMAYRQYKADRHRKAAAHHLQAADTMQRAGRKEDSERHRMMYGMHLKALGYNGDRSKVPVEVRAHLAAVPQAQKHVNLYTPHAADAWVATK